MLDVPLAVAPLSQRRAPATRRTLAAHVDALVPAARPRHLVGKGAQELGDGARVASRGRRGGIAEGGAAGYWARRQAVWAEEVALGLFVEGRGEDKEGVGRDGVPNFIVRHIG